ncbi:hypothetical protein FA95DRAFT_1506941, partial [Auriscalpium vulgare]
HYRETLAKLSKAKNKTARAAITRNSGISRLPLCMFSPAYLHPSFFPLDPFHLIYENCMLFLYDTWTTHSSPDEIVHLSAEKSEKFGQLVAQAMSTLPPAFCGPIRDPFLKRQSQYKIFEWMALLHWYIIPLGLELGFNAIVLANFAKFVEIADIAMTIQAHTSDDLKQFQIKIKDFLEEYERIYVGKDPEKATVERAIGEIGHKVRSKKAPFANVATIIWERELMRLIVLYEPSLAPVKTPYKNQRFIKEVKILKSESKNQHSNFRTHLAVICTFFDCPIDQAPSLSRWAKYVLKSGHTLTSKLFEMSGEPVTRSSKHFEAHLKEPSQPVFGQALAFYEATDDSPAIVVYIPLINCKMVLRRWQGKWGKDIKVLPVTSIDSLIGIIECEDSERVHILRKHPGLELLTSVERDVPDTIDVDSI